MGPYSANSSRAREIEVGIRDPDEGSGIRDAGIRIGNEILIGAMRLENDLQLPVTIARLFPPLHSRHRGNGSVLSPIFRDPQTPRVGIDEIFPDPGSRHDRLPADPRSRHDRLRGRLSVFHRSDWRCLARKTICPT